MVRLTHPYMITGKTIAMTIGTFVGKVMSLLFNITSRFVIAFLPGSKHLLILCLKTRDTLLWNMTEETHKDSACFLWSLERITVSPWIYV